MIQTDSSLYKTGGAAPQSTLRASNSHAEAENTSLDARVSKSAKIAFEKIVLTKDQLASRDLRGSVALTRDDDHKGWLHILIFIGQLLNAIFTGKSCENINLCHGEVILGVNQAQGKEGHLILAHGLFDGIKTTSENHQKDEVITAVHIFRPVDKKMRELFAKFAEQTAVNFKQQGIDPKSKNFKVRQKKEVGQFSIEDMLQSFFHRQVLKPNEKQQRRAALAAADLLRGDKLRDAEGNLASYFCTAYMMTLMQGTSLVSALTEQEQKDLAGKTRDEIADLLAKRIMNKQNGDLLSATYWENEFMQTDARYTMSFFAGDVLDRASAVVKA